MRSLRILAALVVFFAIGAPGVAEDQPKSSVVRESAAGNLKESPQGVKAVPAPVPKVRYARLASQPFPGIEQRQHIQQAIGHLEAAGLKDEATRLRTELGRLELTELEMQKQRKAAELHELDARIRLLRSQSWADRAVTIRLSMVEIPHEWLEAMLADLRPGGRSESITKASPSASATMIVEDGESVERLISVLSQQEVVKILSRPVIKTLNGNPATVLVGGEVPRVIPAGGKGSSIDFDWVGFKMTAVPTIVDEQITRLQLLMERRDRDADTENVRHTKVQTTVELRNWQTFLMTRPSGKEGHDLLTVIKLDVNELLNGIPTAAKPRVESPYTSIPLSPPRLEPVPEPIPETAELPAPANVVR